VIIRINCLGGISYSSAWEKSCRQLAHACFAGLPKGEEQLKRSKFTELERKEDDYVVGRIEANQILNHKRLKSLGWLQSFLPRGYLDSFTFNLAIIIFRDNYSSS
jgi:hypothetical protein